MTSFWGAMPFFWRLRFSSFFVCFWGCGLCRSPKSMWLNALAGLRSVLGPGINFVVPFLDRVRAQDVSILERQLPTAHQDAITTDNVLVKVETSGVSTG